MIIMIFSKLMSKKKVINQNAMIIFVLLQMYMDDDNHYFNNFECGHTHTCGVVLHRFPSLFSFSPSLDNNER